MNCIDVNHSVVEFLSKPEQLNLPKIVVAAKVSLWQDDNRIFDRFPTKEELLGNVEPILTLNTYTELSLEDKRKEELDKAQRDWRNASDDRGYPTYALQPILDEINARYDELIKAKSKEEVVDTKPLSPKEKLAAIKAKRDNPNSKKVFKSEGNIELNESINEEIAKLKAILPKDIAVDLSDSYLQVLSNGRIAVGYFKQGMIYLTNYGPKGTAYHEAFHAVFRTSLSEKDRENIYKEARLNYVKPTKADIDNLIRQNNISADEARKLYYEELLADEFAAFLNNPEAHEYYEEYPKGILGLFKRLLSWIKNIFASNYRTKQLFNSINAGNFVDKATNDSFGNVNAAIEYSLVATNILMSDKAKQIFDKGKKNNWSLDKILTELQIPKNQKKLLLDLGITDREELLLAFTSAYTYTVELNTAKDKTVLADMRFEGELPNTQYYSSLTVPGGTNYTENEIATPAIVPSIKGHAQFSTDKGIGWFRSDEQLVLETSLKPLQRGTFGKFTKVKEVGLEDEDVFIGISRFERGLISKDRLLEEYGVTDDLQQVSKKTKTRRILEVQSDLFQKGRNAEELIGTEAEILYELDRIGKPDSTNIDDINEARKRLSTSKQNQFLQLLNKDKNWVTFFVKSIIQDSAREGYEKVLFPSGDTASKVEGHETLENELNNINNEIEELNQLLISPIIERDGFFRFDTKFKKYNLPKSSKEELIKYVNNNINQLEARKADLKSNGIAKLKPIYDFYENRVKNLLDKAGYNPTRITDEYGNDWFEVNLEGKQVPIAFSTVENPNSISRPLNNLPQFTNAEVREITKQLTFIALHNENKELLPIDQINLDSIDDQILTYIYEYSEEGTESYNEELALRFSEVYENIDFFKKQINKYLKSLGINQKEEDYVEDENGSVVPFNNYEVPDKSSATDNTKLLVALTPDHVFDTDGNIKVNTDTYLGLPKFVNYADTWNIMKTKLQGIVSIVQNGLSVDPFILMVNKLKSAGKYRPNLVYIANKLENLNEKTKSEFFVTFSSMRMNYVDHLKSGTHGQMISKITTSDTSTKDQLIFESWGDEFAKKVGVLNSRGDQYIYNTEKINSALEQFGQFKLAVLTRASELEVLGKLNHALLSIGVDMTPLALKQVIDDLTPYGGTFHEGASNLLKQLGDALQSLKTRSGLISKSSNQILDQASTFKEILAKTQSAFSTQPGEQQVPGPEGNKKYLYQNNNSISKRLAQMNQGDNTFLRLLKESVFHVNSVWLKYILDEDNNGDNTIERLNNIRLTAYNNYKFEGEGDQGDAAPDLKVPDQMDDVINKYLKGYLIGLAEADKSQQQYFYGLPLVNSQFGLLSNGEIGPLVKNGNVVRILKGYLIDELKRMTVAYDHLHSEDPNIKLKEEDQVIYYHYGSKPGDGKGNWKRSYIFPKLPLKDMDLVDEYGKPKELTPERINNPELNKYIENEFLKMLNNDVLEATKNGIIRKTDNGYENETLSIDLFKSDTNKKGYGNVIEAISDYTLNSIISNVEQVKMFNGDPAFYKFKGDEFGDFRKRIFAALASGKDFRIYFDNAGNPIVRDHYMSAVIENIEKPSAYFTNPANIKRIADKYKITEEEVKERVGYSKVNVTDAQAWITLDTYKERMLGLGKWTDDHEAAYTLINLGEDLPVEKIGMFAQPLKTVHFELVPHKGLLVPHYNKQSEAVLLPQLVNGQPMQRLLDAMTAQKIDHVIVLDGKKSGATNVAKVLGEDGEIMPAKDIKLVGSRLSYNNLFLQQDLPTKQVHATQVASQIQKNVLLLVSAMRYYKNNKSGDALVDEYHSIIKALSDIGVEELHEKIGWNEETESFDLDKFYESMIDEFEGDVSDNIIDGFLMHLPLDAFPQLRKKIENKNNAVVTKKTVKLKQNGGAFIMLSSFGFVGKEINRDANIGNGVAWIKNFGKELQPMRVGEKSTIEKAQVLIPHTMVCDIFAELGLDYRTMSSKELAALIDPKILEGISYRIPNQGSSSNDAFEIVGILPPEAGDTMIAFNEITAKTGSDFDIDKAYVILPNFAPKFDNAGMLQELKDNLPSNLKNANFDLSDINLLQERRKSKDIMSEAANNLLDYYESVEKRLKKKYFTGLKYISYDPKTPTKKGLENRRLEIMMEFLTHPDVFFNVMAPLDDDSIIKDYIVGNKDKGIKGLFPEEASRKDGDLWFWTGTNQLQTKSTFDNAKSLVGAIANHMVHHPLCLLDGVQYNPKFFVYEDGFITVKLVSVDKSQPYSTGEVKTVEAALGAFMNAIVDAAKDPYISRANINQFTASTAFMLVREGINPHKVIAWMAQPIIRDLVEVTSRMEGRISKKERHTSGSMKGRIIKPLDVVLEKYGFDISEKTSNQFKSYFFTNLKQSLKKDAMSGFDDLSSLEKMITNPKEEDNNKQLYILYKFLQWQNRSKSLNKLISASRADTMGATKNINSAFIRNQIVEEVLTPDKDGNTAFINADVLLGAKIDNGKLVFNKSRFISTYHQNSVNESLKLARSLFLNATPAMRQSLSRIALKAGYRFLNDEYLADNITEELYAIIASRFPALTLDYEELETLVNELPKRVTEAKKSQKFADNDFIQSLDLKRGFGTFKDVLVFNSRGLEADAKNDVYVAWEELLQEDKSLGEDLIRYAFFSSGFRQSFGAFYEHIPTSWLKETGFDVYIKEQMKLMDNADYLKDLEVEVFQHSLNNNKLIPRLYYGTYKKLFNGDIIEIDPTKSEEYTYAVADGTPRFKTYLKEAIPVAERDQNGDETGRTLKTMYKLYELIGTTSYGAEDESSTAYYKRIPHYGLSYKGVTLRENGTYATSIFEDNQFTPTVNLNEFIKKTNIQPQDNIFSSDEYINKRVNKTEEEVDLQDKMCGNIPF